MLKTLYKLKLIIIYFIVIYIIIISLVVLKEKQDTASFLQNKTELTQVEFEAIYMKVKEQSTMIFQEQINTDEIINLYKNAYTSDEKTQSKIRDELYQKLLPSYTRLKNLIHLKQVHFHLPNNHSFLRMHRPKKFGDDLSEVRESVVYVNKYKKAIDGFEEGRVYNGFRFVYPLFDKEKKYIGSVEVSFSSNSFQNTLNDDIRFSQFIFSKDIVTAKVWKEEYLSNYEGTVISPKFLLESNWHKNSFTPFKKKIQKNITLEIKEKFDQNIKSQKAYSVLMKIDNDFIILSFLPIKNVLTKKLSGYLVIILKSEYLHNHHLESLILSLISFALLMSLFIIIYRHEKYEEKIQGQEKVLLELRTSQN